MKVTQAPSFDAQHSHNLFSITSQQAHHECLVLRGGGSTPKPHPGQGRGTLVPYFSQNGPGLEYDRFCRVDPAHRAVSRSSTLIQLSASSSFTGSLFFESQPGPKEVRSVCLKKDSRNYPYSRKCSGAKKCIAVGAQAGLKMDVCSAPSSFLKLTMSSPRL